MYNFRLHDAVVAALEEELQNLTDSLVSARGADFGEYRYRIGQIHGVRHAMNVAEATRKKLLQE